jgi:polysaccharide biosynthesis/export protein
MARGSADNDRPEHETLDLADFVAHNNATQPGTERAMLVTTAADGGQQLYPITRNPTVIGRSINADLVLPDAGISDFHARIIKHSFGYTVEDLGSAEGTFLGDRRVNHARMVNGDVLRLATTVLTFLDQRPAATREPMQNRSLVPFLPAPGVFARQTRLRDGRGTSSDPTEVPSAPPPHVQRRLPQAEDAGPSIDELVLKLIRIARYLRRHAWSIAAFAVTALGLAAVSFKVYPPVRSAYSVVMLHPAPRVNPIEPEARQSQTDPMQFFVGVERAFTSNDSIMAALWRIGVPSPTEAQAEAIGKRLRFESVGNHTYSASYTPSLFSERNDWHVGFLDAHIKNYVEKEVEKKLKVFVAEAEFLRSQTQAAEKRLQEIMQQTVSYREEHSDQILAQGTLTAGSPADLETRRIEVLGRISRLEGELAGVRSQLSRGSALSQAKAQAGQADREAIAAVSRKLAELRAQGFADGHPDVQRLLVEQSNLQHMVDQHLHAEVTQFEKRSNVAYDALQGQVDQLEAQLRAARSERGTIEASFRELRNVSSGSAKVNARIDELARMKEEAERQHALLFDRLQKAEVQLQLERVSATSRYEVVVPARLEAAPGKKAFALRLAMGLGIGLVLAAIVLGIGEMRHLIARVSERNTAMLTLVLLLMGAQGCAHDGRFTWVQDLPLQDPVGQAVIRPRDTILVEVDKQPTLSGEFVVRDDGHYTQPMVGSVEVAGQTPRQVAVTVETALKPVVVSPLVSVWITKVHPARVSVVGEVKTPGTYELARDRGLLAVLAQAGWLTEFAHAERVFVVRSATSERIRFRVQDITAAEPHAAQFQLSDADVVVVE